MPRIHLSRIAVAEGDIDVNRHGNNLAYLRCMQEAAVAHSAVQGWPLERYVEAGAGWFVRSHFIEYLQPAFAGETLLLHTWVHAMRTSRSPPRFLFVREGDGVAVAKAETLWAYVDLVRSSVWGVQDLEKSFPIRDL